MGKLPAEGTQARRFGKTRSAQSTALLEDYVELIADLLTSAGEARPTDIARRLGVSHATAIKTISRLKRAGLATARPYRGVFLTEKGQALADRVRVRHRLVVDVLCALGVPTEVGRGGCRGHRAPRLGNDAEGIRAFPQIAGVAETDYAAWSVSASTMPSTTSSTSALSSPSPMTRITGSVPDGRTTSRPWPLRRCSASSIAERTSAFSSGLPLR